MYQITGCCVTCCGVILTKKPWDGVRTIEVWALLSARRSSPNSFINMIWTWFAELIRWVRGLHEGFTSLWGWSRIFGTYMLCLLFSLLQDKPHLLRLRQSQYDNSFNCCGELIGTLEFHEKDTETTMGQREIRLNFNVAFIHFMKNIISLQRLLY